MLHQIRSSHVKDLYSDNKLNTHRQNHLTIFVPGEVTNKYTDVSKSCKSTTK